jgi:hypothetical protein
MKNSTLSALFFAASLLTPLPGQQPVDCFPKPSALKPATSITPGSSSATVTSAPKNTPPTTASTRPAQRARPAHLFM